MARKMDSGELLSIIRSHRDDALGVEDGDLSTERAAALNHYHGRPYGNEVEGRSQVVSRDLAEAVDWAMPGIMRVFFSSGNLGEFDPLGPEDEPLAQQESDYVNQALLRDNNGFMVLHDAIKDALLLKNGYTKRLWETQDKIREEEYTGLSMDQIAMMVGQLEAQGSMVEIKGQASRLIEIPSAFDPMTGQPVTQEVFDIRLRVTSKQGKFLWMAVPSEEVRVSRKCRGSLQESPFTEHVTRKTRSELVEMGMPFDFVDSLSAIDTESDNGTQSLARNSSDDESDSMSGAVGDKSMDEIEYCEAYIRVDFDGDGVAELRKVVTVGDRLPPGEDWNEPIEAVSLTTYVAKRVPHRHTGESLDDELADLQEIMTVLKRQMLDNVYLSNNGEIVINEDANLRDFMTRTPGGVKRTKGSNPVGNAVMPLVTPQIIGQLLPVLDFFENSKESRTGISKATTGLDPDTLKQSTKGAFLENLNRASQKMEMIARMLAETGVKEDVLQTHALLMRHQDKARMVQLRGKWVNVNPQEWKERTDLTVRVGLGTGNREEKRQELMMLAERQEAVSVFGLVGPQQAYNMFEDFAEALGCEMPEKYIITPNSPEHQQLQQQMQQQGAQPNQLAEAEQIKAGATMQVAAQKDQFEREREMMRAQLQQQREAADRQHEAGLEQMRLANDRALEHARIASTEALETMKTEMNAWLEGLRIDLGRQGVGAGVQQAPGAEMPQQTSQQQPEQPGPMA